MNRPELVGLRRTPLCLVRKSASEDRGICSAVAEATMEIANLGAAS